MPIPAAIPAAILAAILAVVDRDIARPKQSVSQRIFFGLRG
jgi:hypothetical protein